jgi:cyclopropane fatty-acyl-phospholipid synthase-like methyltransferase
MNEHYQNMKRRYQEGNTPWDDALPPPEVMALVEQMQPGRMLDMGCGTGRAARYLARSGWQCTGVDFVPEAIELAKQRALEQNIASRTAFYVASVTDLSFLTQPYDLVLDIGCMHPLPFAEQQAYATEIKRLLLPGGTYLLFARLSDEVQGTPNTHGHGVDSDTIRQLFTPDLALERVEYGKTRNPDSEWQSAWFWMVKEWGV